MRHAGVHLLWINLVTDGLPALALALEPAEPGVMRRRPRRPRDSILPWPMGVAIAFQGVRVAAVGLAAFGLAYRQHPDNAGRARSLAFCVLMFAELLRALAARSWTLPVARLGPFTNPYLLAAIAVSAALQVGAVMVPLARPLFETVEHAPGEWAAVAGLAVVPLVVIEMSKYVRAWMGAAAGLTSPPAP